MNDKISPEYTAELGRQLDELESENEMLRHQVARLKATQRRLFDESSIQPQCALRAAAERVCWFDWSDNDMDARAAIDALRKAVTDTRPDARQREALSVIHEISQDTNVPCWQAIQNIAATAAKALARPDEWEALRGAAPNATGDLSSEEFIRQHRDEWDKADPDVTRPDLSTVEKRNAFYSSDEYRNMTTAEKCAVQGDGFINDHD